MKQFVLIALLTPFLSGCWVYTNIQGNGTVTSPATGNFNCTTGSTGDCEQEYTVAGSETLEATPEPGYTFSKWENCPYESIETCKTLWTQELADGNDPWTVTATFKEQNPPVQAAQYTYNALGQRITKKVGSEVTIFQYDLDGNLMAEIDASTGQSLRQHIHVNGEPVAQLTTNLSDGVLSVQYVHADHLGTPTLLTNQSGQVVADIEATPFGETYIDYAEVTHNRRFPGQYKDEETGLHYNYFRDYDPSLGRYIQSDPIGLQGGLNTYAYVGGNPLIYSDPYGESFAHAGRLGWAAGAGINAGVRHFAGVTLSTMLADAAWDALNDEECEDECAKLIEKINRAKNGIARRFRQLAEDRGGIDQATHWEQLRGRQRNLRKLLNEAASKGCKIPPDAWYWASR